MAKITLSPIELDGEKQIKITFDQNPDIAEYVRQFPHVIWSDTQSAFHVPFSTDMTNQLFQYLRAKKHYVDYSALRGRPNPSSPKEAKKTVPSEAATPYEKTIGDFEKWMRQKRYSDNTIATYASMIKLFLSYHRPKKIEELNKKDLERFNSDYIMARNYSYTFQNQLVNALKLFYSRGTGHQMEIEQLERPKKSQRLPEVLSIDEVKELLGRVRNNKHKTLLSLIYSCGLRIGEALALKLTDIDFGRNLIHIKSGKGRKDRYIPLSSTMKEMLKRYYTQYRPTGHVFEGAGKKAYSSTSARQVLKRALAQTRITKHVTLHTLRHSYATHLLENGTDIRFIQELLGHNSPKTTMIYTHVSSTSLEKIKNPFDDFEI